MFVQSEVYKMLESLGYVDDGDHLLFPLDPESLQEFQVIIQGYESLLKSRINNQNASAKNKDNKYLNAVQGKFYRKGNLLKDFFL